MADDRQVARAIGQDVVPARELLRRLGISRQHLARLTAAAGPRIVRLGHTRATRYALAREVTGIGFSLPLRRINVSGAPEVVGTLHPLAGGRHLLRTASDELLFEGIPPFLEEARPQGFLGLRFAARHAELGLPPRLRDWSTDHLLLALAHRGEDAPGDLLLGDASFDRWLRLEPAARVEGEYPAIAREVEHHEVGSSAGGEHPKFAIWNGTHHVLVKYAPAEDAGPAAGRWRDLLVCEALALEVVAQEGLAAARGRWLDQGGLRFLEVERFDRVGFRGRLGMVSLAVWSNEALERTHLTWTSAAAEMAERKHLTAEEARRVRWLDAFGALIANSDRHLGNVSLFWDLQRAPRLAPIYDMLPMLFAPSGVGLIERAFVPAPPNAANLDVWPDAARAAALFWTRVCDTDALSRPFRALAERCGEAVEQVRSRHAHLSRSP